MLPRGQLEEEMSVKVITNMASGHELGKSLFKRLVDLDESYWHTLPFSVLHNCNPPLTFLVGTCVAIPELESLFIFDLVIYHNGISSTKG